MSRVCVRLAVVIITAFFNRVAPASTIVLSAVSSGWYNDSGTHDSNTPNYIVGSFSSQGFHNYFVFDRSSIAGFTINSARLDLYNVQSFPIGGGFSGGFGSVNPTETFVLHDVTTAIGVLIAGQSGRTDIYADLGSGTVYGSKVVSAADNGTTVMIPLNAAAINALDGGSGMLALGGELLGVVPSNDNRYVFAGSQFSPIVKQLVLDATLIPEPSTLVLAAIGLVAGLLSMRRSRV